ncbi:MAG: nuclear transport factor 2 family protein [Actinomycetota bacterium]|nr:nuclear transport factor 2 family protein [Actinomycetota bacterium]
MTGAELAREYVDAFNRRDLDGWVALFSEDALIFEPFFPEPTKGREAIKALQENVQQAFSDMRWRLLHPAIHVGDAVVMEIDVKAVNDGPLEMPDGTVPATGKPIAYESCSVLTVGTDGLILEERNYFDATGVAAQLGLLG